MGRSPAALRLGDDLRIAQARATYESIAACAERKRVRIDGSRVARIDGAGLQALAVAIGRLGAADIAVEWEGVAEPLAKAAALAGLAAALRLPSPGEERTPA